jgi:hypothetical protein
MTSVYRLICALPRLGDCRDFLIHPWIVVTDQKRISDLARTERSRPLDRS